VSYLPRSIPDHPEVLAIERVFANQNANTAMGTAQAGGVIALAAARRDIDAHFHTPRPATRDAIMRMAWRCC
jgi:Holliday junction resolvasome RuvABC endonuclease subunit